MTEFWLAVKARVFDSPLLLDPMGRIRMATVYESNIPVNTTAAAD